MSYGALHGVVTFRPLEAWPGPPTQRRRPSPFGAPMTRTVEELVRELRALDAKKAVLQIDVPDRMIRQDGLPRADARPSGPGVVLAFDSVHGPMQFPCDTFVSWEANVRAVALGMEALRRVDRYGITRSGEQYRGWRALPVSTDPVSAIQTEAQAWAVIVRAAGIPADSSPLLNGISQERALRKALHATHPDKGGDDTEFRKVLRARELLGL